MAFLETKLFVCTTALLAYFDSAVLTRQRLCHWYNMFGLQRADITVMTDQERRLNKQSQVRAKGLLDQDPQL